MNQTTIKPGVREQKRQETLKRIADVGLRLFLANGYEETTLEAIAMEAGITKRTIFYYYKSKDEILRVWQGSHFSDAIVAGMLKESKQQVPLAACRHCLLELVARHETKESIRVDRLFQATESLKMRKQITFLEWEGAMLTGLTQLWPEKKFIGAMQSAAMVSVGTLRLAMEAWRRDAGRKRLAVYLQNYFDDLQRSQEMGGEKTHG
jgi:AcrR family transcriptional regulator